MDSGLATLTGGRGSQSIGTVSGFVFKLARQSAGLTQEKLAEALAADVTTVQGWESGRRPLAAMGAGAFLRLCARLSRLGAPASTGRHLREAIEADQVLSTGVSAGSSWIDAEVHPLAARVHRQTITNLITWPFTQQLPRHLCEFVPKIPRRGPVATYPALTAEARTRFLDHLLTVAERGNQAGEALLRRQSVYLLGFDHRPQTTDWLRDEWKRAGRRPVRDGDIAALLEARSASVALASVGDRTQLHDFVGTTFGGRAEIANLTYWAHWIGELSEEQTTDAFMTSNDTRLWSGASLLRHLVSRLEPCSPHLPLNLYTLHALVASRPELLDRGPATRARLAGVLDRLDSSAELTRSARTQVAGLLYALRIARD
ncbi:hypothetical protein [Alloactinosynnema sp. L-07]|uniref:helix-turn-helix domain-containing protein n=1 Tax=Alloactinosynnema sp. L-07 TaxID=1653480 RepID=UPI00065F04FF|nr:transcriptional regulator [Alloactinosynnema sp. L-07]CRK60025.1 hypothetical protein [Alloactinosynnema sp. L-07]